MRSILEMPSDDLPPSKGRGHYYERKFNGKGDFIMKQFKKILVGCLLVLVLSSVTACGSNDNGTTDGTTENGNGANNGAGTNNGNGANDSNGTNNGNNTNNGDKNTGANGGTGAKEPITDKNNTGNSNGSLTDDVENMGDDIVDGVEDLGNDVENGVEDMTEGNDKDSGNNNTSNKKANGNGNTKDANGAKTANP